MNVKIILVVASLIVSVFLSCNNQNNGGHDSAPESGEITAAALKTDIDSMSYVLGVTMGQNFKQMRQQGIDTLNFSLFMGAMEASLYDKKLIIDPTDASGMTDMFFRRFASKMSANNLDVTNEFLEKNKDEEGVIVLPSGLQYKVLINGTGPKPLATDNVTTHYHGTTVDGSVFDSSIDRGEPATFPLNGVIKGWTEALQLMSVGSKWLLWVPPDLAYGEQGGPGGVNALLIFEIELLSIE